MKSILGRKIGMTQYFTSSGLAMGATIVSVGPCYVIRKQEKGLEVGFEVVHADKLNKPKLGVMNKHNLPPLRIVKTLEVNPEPYVTGDIITVEIFNEGEGVDITSISKGRGFTGAMKRWNFKGGNRTHGATQWHRRVGAIGQRSTPGKVFKGKKMPGHYGASKVTVKNLTILKLFPEKNLMLVKGSVPGANGNLVIVRYSHEN
ncbi:MAG: 50S ribosomal protein L3 [candidate division WS2 bacterium]|uniref:Large ribosomal subunit protein uL3 n=1 Tax=Psychracetigena formicireducens TaxID=2986056 RepID=A0A9E2F1E8_PSYF1|nr:50S ribosomal protein L3 [Candidatus Psychracetigena formicireducens]MBT9144657.1 50S ribosomal protein L3 [Candidatus Psychracetigena formicireducens]MBT9150844.1 50S ribosomal protein L3 [Candidatus Psychracetigena formicireducens]